MKVKELIEKLKTYDQEKEIYIGMYCEKHDYEYSTVFVDISEPDMGHEPDGVVMLGAETSHLGSIPTAEHEILMELEEIVSRQPDNHVYSRDELCSRLMKQAAIVLQ